MLSFIFLVNFLIINATFCLQQNHEDTYKFFKASTNLPGPTMSFNIPKGFGVFQFQFQTSIARALLLYRDDFGERDFLSLFISNGLIVFSFCGRNVNNKIICERFSTDERYNDSRYHTVKTVYKTFLLQLFIDDQLKMENNVTLKLNSNLQLGGFPPRRYSDSNSITDHESFKIFATLKERRGYFIGCIRNIKFGFNQSRLHSVQDIPSLRHHVTKGNCNFSARGTGYEEVSCTKDVDECNLEEAVCPSQATCINTVGSYVCKYAVKDPIECGFNHVRNDACQRFPCYPGRECWRRSNGSFQCEKCPRFFSGDGVECVLNESQEIWTKKVKISLENTKWLKEISNESSINNKMLNDRLKRSCTNCLEERQSLSRSFSWIQKGKRCDRVGTNVYEKIELNRKQLQDISIAVVSSMSSICTKAMYIEKHTVFPSLTRKENTMTSRDSIIKDTMIPSRRTKNTTIYTESIMKHTMFPSTRTKNTITNTESVMKQTIFPSTTTRNITTNTESIMKDTMFPSTTKTNTTTNTEVVKVENNKTESSKRNKAGKRRPMILHFILVLTFLLK